MVNKKILSIAFIFAVCSQINAQTAETAEPPAQEPVKTAPQVQQPQPAVQPAPPAPPMPQPQPEPQAAASPKPQTQSAPAPAVAAPAKEDAPKRHEIKLDILYPMLSMIKVGYEYSLSHRQALALNIRYDFSEKPEIQVQPLLSYKLYLTKQETGAWLFIEPDAGYTTGYVNGDKGSGNPLYGEEDDPANNSSSDKKSYGSFTVGISGGLKYYIPKTNVGFEAAAGVNRVYDKGEGKSYKEWVPQYGVNLVWRF
jgi:hypothetical protein